MDALAPFRDFLEVFESLPGVQFWIKDRRGRFLSANRAFLSHFGLTGFSALDRRTDFDVSGADFAREYSLDDRTVLVSGRPIRDKLELVRSRDGSLGWYCTTKIPLKNAQGEVWGTAGITRKVQDVGEDRTAILEMDAIARILREEYHRDLSMTDLARKAGLSLVQFERRFRRIHQETPLRYLNRVRLRVAAQLLSKTDCRIKEVAAKAGFPDQGYFSKLFLRFHGLTPSNYRQRYRPTTPLCLPALRTGQDDPSQSVDAVLRAADAATPVDEGG